ncbi:hypothetical protein [Paraburkholderia jirisanensis]
MVEIGLISVSINAGSQYIQNGSVNPVDVAGAFSTGAAGSYGKLLWNVGVNAFGGATTTALNNIIQGKNDSVVGSAFISGALSSLGYGLGKAAETSASSLLKPSLNTQSWASSGDWSGSSWNLFGSNKIPTVGGSVSGGVGQELINNIYQNMESSVTVKK